MANSIRQQEDLLFALWRGQQRFAAAEFNPDGLVDAACYAVAPVKQLFLMKQVAEPCDLRVFLRGGAHPKRVSSPWTAITRWTCGVEQFIATGRVPCWHEVDLVGSGGPESRGPLGRIGAVNLVKEAGGGTSDDKAVLAGAQAAADQLRQQLALYTADLTICCGSVVWEAVSLLNLPDLGPVQSTRRGVRYRTAGRLGTLIDFVHPASRGAPSHTFYALIDAIAEIRLRR